MSIEPTILVKKADGTTERVPLSQLQKNKTSKPTAVVLAPPTPTEIKSPQQTPQKLRSQSELNTKVSQDEFSDPFEPLEGVMPNESVVPDGREVEVEKILKKMSFKVAPAVEGRLRSLVLSKLKDIRTIEQLKTMALRLVTDGGVGLTPAQANEVANKCLEYELPATLMGLPPAKSASAGAVAKSTPTNGFVYAKKQVSPNPALEPKIAPLSVTKPLEKILKQEPSQHTTILSGTESRLRTMQDIQPVTPEEIGPVDEIRMMTLTDFRRLSQNPAEAAARLGQKFVAIKEENILLYLSALAAWKQSPLFKDYILVVTAGINNRKRIDVVVGEKNGIQVPEIQAILTVEKTFTI